MGKIHVLGFEIANLIAAGEVVDRPASVVKELLENALDAGADRITVEIKNGGVSLIRVTDNGCGISSEDLPVAIRRHATSKISSADDLAAIMTLGFRGEALAAISSVSDMTIITKTREAQSGTMLAAKAGEVTEISEVGCTDGTSVLIENLFGNVPARRKFLKKDATEAAAVSATVEKIAISRADIAIRLVIDGNEKFATTGDGSLQNALYAILGRDFALRLLPVSGEANGIMVSGFVGRSDNARGNRNAQNFFINGRYIRSKTMTAALERAFHSYLAPEKFPVCTLFLTCNPQLVDVNVHPAKLEVRFSNEQAVFEAVYYAVRATLEAGGTRPELTLEKPKRETTYRVDATPIGTETPQYRVSTLPSSSASFDTPRTATRGGGASPRRAAEQASMSFPRSSLAGEADPCRSGEMLGRIANESGRASGSYGIRMAEPTLPARNVHSPLPEAPASAAPALPPYRLIGDVFHTYLLVELGEELLLIDQHAAHERILYERLLADRKKDGKCLSQSMLIPLTPVLSEQERAYAEEYRAELSSLGFAFEIKGNAVSLSAIPDAVAIRDAEELFAKMCRDLGEGTGDPALTLDARRERALYSVACKAAIKGGRTYDRAHLEWLVAQVLAFPDITVCPHGRPIAVKLSKGELDRRFDRIK